MGHDQTWDQPGGSRVRGGPKQSDRLVGHFRWRVPHAKYAWSSSKNAEPKRAGLATLECPIWRCARLFRAVAATFPDTMKIPPCGCAAVIAALVAAGLVRTAMGADSAEQV